MPTQQKIIYAVLAVSLAINLFFIGAAGHTAMKWRAIKNDSGWIETRLDRAEARVTRHLDGSDKVWPGVSFKNGGHNYCRLCANCALHGKISAPA